LKKQIKIDIIILSYAKDDHLKRLTEQTISSLIKSENSDIYFNIIVIESNKTLKPFQFENSVTIYPEEIFGFHKFLNIGIKTTQNEYVCLCNNDLIFHKNWATELLNVLKSNKEILSANPLCDLFTPHLQINRKEEFIIANSDNIFKGILTGWCIFVKRDLFNKIGLLDEQFDFWYADRDYGMTLLKYKIKHVLVPSSIVTHIGNQSHVILTEENKYNSLTHQQEIKFNNKWKIRNNNLSTRLKKISSYWNRIKPI
jgi:GT2 family glycosyltransferase